MPLGVRDFLLVLRAKDQASRIVADVGRSFTTLDANAQAAARSTIRNGTALLGVGAALGAVGAAGVAFMHSNIEAASEYNRTVALTLTQVDQVGVSLDDIGNIGKRVAREIPAPFEQMQSSLYDIFSSMDVGLKGAEKLLTNFSKAGVAGQVDVQSAGRATIAIMNAFKIPVEDVNHVMDVQFQTVRKGVLTYEEFASTIGRSIPAAARAGQNIEQLGGMIAFLTRNGLSAAMASTSAARALEAFANPKVVAKLEAMGIAVRDAKGEFLPLNEVITKLGEKWADLTGPEKVKALQDLLKGAGGTIQARRFWDLAISNFDQLNQRVNEMKNSAGSLDAAYKTMFNTPASQAQLFHNNLQILRVELGEAFLPMLIKGQQIGMKFLKWWQDLSPEMKKTIAYVIMGVSAFTLLVGAITAVAGVFMVLSGAAELLGTSLGAIALVGGGVVLAIAAIVAITIVIIKNWGTIKKVAGAVWSFIKDIVVEAWHAIEDVVKTVASAVVGFVKQNWDILLAILTGPIGIAILVWRRFGDTIRAVVGSIVDAVTGFFNTIVNSGPIQTVIDTWNSMFEDIRGLWGTFASEFMDTWNALWATAIAVLGPFVGGIQTFMQQVADVIGLGVSLIAPILQLLVNGFKLTWDLVVAYVQVAVGVLQGLMAVLGSIFSVAWRDIQLVVEVAMDVIQKVIQVGVDIITALWRAFGDNIVAYVRTVWDLIVRLVDAGIRLVSNVIQFVLAIIRGDWGAAWQSLKDIAGAIWDGITAMVRAGMELVKNVLDAAMSAVRFLWDAGWAVLKGIFQAAWDAVVAAIKAGFDMVQTLFVDLPKKILSWIGDMGSLLVNVGKDLIHGLIKGIQDSMGPLGDVLGKVGGFIADHKGPPAKDAILLTKNGQLIMQGLMQGIQNEVPNLQRMLQDVSDLLLLQTGSPADVMNRIAQPVGSVMGTGGNVTIAEGAVQVTIEGNVTPDAVPMVEDAVSNALQELVMTLRQK